MRLAENNEETKAADAIWKDIQSAIAEIRLKNRALADHLTDHIVRQGNSFKYTGGLKWNVIEAARRDPERA